jgi:hypothetical protein
VAAEQGRQYMRQGNTRTHTPSPPPCAGMATVGRHDTGQELRRPFTAHDPAHYNPVTSVSLRIPDHNKCSRKTERQTGGCGALNKAVLAQVRGATVDGKRPCGWALITDHTVSMQFAGHNKSGLGGGGDSSGWPSTDAAVELLHNKWEKCGSCLWGRPAPVLHWRPDLRCCTGGTWRNSRCCCCDVMGLSGVLPCGTRRSV